MAQVLGSQGSGGARRWTRDYPPLLVVGAGLLIVLAVLPSSLNFPQSNPTQTLEYAPVPPDDNDNPPPAAGNLGSLGLGQSSGIAEAVKAPAPAAPVKALSRNASTKRCVGDPPRQTEDPLSPPCVAFFQGDNFGATYQGVDSDEVRIAFFYPGGFTRPTSRGSETGPRDACFDLAKPPQEDDDVFVRVLRGLQRYFNTRFQTYGRLVRFFVCYDDPAGTPPENRGQDAAEHLATIKPFAFLNFTGVNADAYSDFMLRRGTLSFGATFGKPAEQYNTYPRLVWTYTASIEQQARKFSSFVCKKVVPYGVSFGGNDGDPDARLHNGQPRRLGLLRTDDPAWPQLQLFARLVRKQVEECGGRFFAEGTYPFPYLITADAAQIQAAQNNVARFKQAGVSTVIWAQGWEIYTTSTAAKVNYRPEWVAAGDTQLEGFDIGQLQDQSVWQHAWMSADITLEPTFEQSLCYQALKEADPDFPRADAAFGCTVGQPYESLRQFFTGLQVAGPRLGPTSMNEGFHAIPRIASRDPRVPACFYEPGDYTCVKDSVPMWWDDQATARNNTRGCWRLPEKGKRYLAGAWPREDVPARKTATDPCNGFSASVLGN